MVREISIFLNVMMGFQTDFLKLKFVFIGAMVVITVYAVKGGCLHIFYHTPSQIMETVKLKICGSSFQYHVPDTGRSSVGFLMQRILGMHTLYRKFLIHILMAAVHEK